MDVSEFVQGVDGADHLGDIEHTHILGESIIKLTEQGEQVPAHVVIHEKILQTYTTSDNHQQ